MDANLGLAPHGVLANPMTPSMSKAQLQIKLQCPPCTGDRQPLFPALQRKISQQLVKRAWFYRLTGNKFRNRHSFYL